MKREPRSDSKLKKTRRSFLRKASYIAYVAPAVLTLKAAPAEASLGSNRGHGHDGDWEHGWLEKLLEWWKQWPWR